MSNYAAEGSKLVLGDRNASYGTPEADYAKTAKIWSGMLIHKLLPGIEITAKEAVLMMAALKISREMHQHKPDNLIDAHGYLTCAEWIEAGKRPDDIKNEVELIPEFPISANYKISLAEAMDNWFKRAELPREQKDSISRWFKKTYGYDYFIP